MTDNEVWITYLVTCNSHHTSCQVSNIWVKPLWYDNIERIRVGKKSVCEACICKFRCYYVDQTLLFCSSCLSIKNPNLPTHSCITKHLGTERVCQTRNIYWILSAKQCETTELCQARQNPECWQVKSCHGFHIASFPFFFIFDLTACQN